MDDLASLFFDDDEPDAQAKAAALSAALRRQRDVGTLGMLTGDKVLSQLGKAMRDDASHERGALAQTGQHRAGQRLQRALQAQQQAFQGGESAKGRALDRERLDQESWSAIADPVTGGIAMFNRKTGEVRPLGPGGGQPGPAMPNIGKPTEKQRNDATSARGNVGKLDLAIDTLEENPGAYGGAANFAIGAAEKMTPGFMAPVIQSAGARALKPGELKAKNVVTNVVSQIINKRAGSSVTLNEELRQKFLPTETDGLEQTLQKLRDLRELEILDYKAAAGEEVSSEGADPKDAAKRRAEALIREAQGGR